MLRTLAIVSMLSAMTIQLCGCGKEEQNRSEPAARPAPTTVPAGDVQEPATAPAGQEPTPQTLSATPGATGPATTQANGDLTELKIELPPAVEIGTPKNVPPDRNPEPYPVKAPPPLMVPAAAVNVARGKPVTSSSRPITPMDGKLDRIVDGEKQAAEGKWVTLGPRRQWVQIDLGAQHKIYAIALWHRHDQRRVYYDVVVKVGQDKDFIESATVFNNDQDNSIGEGIGHDREYFETHYGQRIDAKGVQGRYIRLYSSGNHFDDLNDYIEVEVYAVPVQ